MAFDMADPLTVLRPPYLADKTGASSTAGKERPSTRKFMPQWAVFGPDGSGTCGFKAALPRQRLVSAQFYPMLRCGHSHAALRSSMFVVGGLQGT